MAQAMTRASARHVMLGVPMLARARWFDRFLSSDPGLNTLRHALQGVVTTAVAFAAEVLFVHFTHALQSQPRGATLSATQAAREAAANHGFLLVAMVLGGVVAMVAAFTAMGEPVSTLYLAVPVIGAFAGGIALAEHAVAALVSFPVVLAIGAYAQRFGQRGVLAGMGLFIGDVASYNLHHGGVRPHQVGWLAAEIAIGAVAAIVVRYVAFYPRPARALRRAQRSYAARSRKVAALVLKLLENPWPGPQNADRVHHQLARLNQTALMIDAHLADPGTVADGSLAQLLHQRLFDAELALGNIARFAEAMPRYVLHDTYYVEARLALSGLIGADNAAARAHATQLMKLLPGIGPDANEDYAVVVAHRFAESVIALANAITEWMAVGATARAGDTFDVQPLGRPSGSEAHGIAKASTIASRERGSRLGERVRLPLHTRSAIQLGIGSALATASGYALGGPRFYWAVLAVYVAFMGTNTSDEKIRKSLGRVVGTVAGVLIAELIVRVLGHNQWVSLVVILVSVFFMFYMLRISFIVFFIAITEMIAQLYVQTGLFSDSLMLTRVKETALGGAIAIIVVSLILPLRSRRVLRVAIRDLVQAVNRLSMHATAHLAGNDHGGNATLRSDARTVDAAYQTLLATVGPSRLPVLGLPDQNIVRVLRLASAVRHYSRDLVTHAGQVQRTSVRAFLDIEPATSTLSRSLDAVVGAVNGARETPYTRSSALFDRAERRLEAGSPAFGPRQAAIRDFTLIDGTMAELAGMLRLPITAYDTEPTPPRSSGTPMVTGQVRAHGSAAAGNVPLSDTSRLSGTVTATADGSPVSGVSITLIDPSGSVLSTEITDSDGNYAFSALGAGTYALAASARYYRPASRRVAVSKGKDLRADIGLTGIAHLSGVVTNKSSSPVAGARVILLDTMGAAVAVADTDEAGRYVIEGLANGQYTVITNVYRPTASTLHINGSQAAIQHNVVLGPDNKPPAS
jgi:uncharacterized membrane protein YgaE (UPF0421/DUF939 family)